MSPNIVGGGGGGDEKTCPLLLPCHVGPVTAAPSSDRVGSDQRAAINSTSVTWCAGWASRAGSIM